MIPSSILLPQTIALNNVGAKHCGSRTLSTQKFRQHFARKTIQFAKCFENTNLFVATSPGFYSTTKCSLNGKDPQKAWMCTVDEKHRLFSRIMDSSLNPASTQAVANLRKCPYPNLLPKWMDFPEFNQFFFPSKCYPSEDKTYLA